MPKSTSHHPRIYPMRIHARGGSLVAQRYFCTIVARMVAQPAGD